MRAGIVGTGWGRAHVGTLRRAGHEIAVFVGRDPEHTRRVAREEGVPLGTTDPRALEDVDLIVVAAPTAAHAEYVRAFAHKKLICEKPLFGLAPPPDAGALAANPRLFVSYAFGFLEVASILRARIAELGPVRRVRVENDVDLDRSKPASHWLAESAVHPLSFVHELALREVELELGTAKAPGIDVRIAIDGTAGAAVLSGAYRVGGAWRYELELRGERFVEEGGDPWYEANCRCVAAILDAMRGRSVPAVYDGARALRFEAGLTRFVAGLSRLG